MQSQKSKTVMTNDENSSLKSSMKSRFEQISKTPATRTVTLKYKSCCGCGCNYVDVTKEVPYESKWKDGNIISDNELSALGY